MNSKEFLAEALKSEKCPADFENIYRNFQKYQLLALNTLKEFHRVCEKNDITYMLIDGSLLGAVRNNGQIPWDYDIDVFVPLEQRDKLIEALRKDMSPDYYFYCPEINNKCRHFFMRVAPKGYRTEELHVDVFYYVGAPDDEEMRKKIAGRIETLITHRFSKLVNVREASYGRLKSFLRLTLNKLKTLRISVDSEYTEFDQLKNKWPLNNTGYILRADQFNWDRSYNDGHFRCYFAEDFAETVVYNTEVGSFRVPKGYQRILSETYGNYMSEPAIESCIREVISSYSKLMRAKK